MSRRSTLQLPPYGRRLRELLADPAALSGFFGTSPDGRRPSLWVLVGEEAWEAGRILEDSGRHLFMLMPPDTFPERYNWELLRGRDPVLVRQCGHLDDAILQRLVLSMMRDGVWRILFLPLGGQPRRFIRQGSTHAA